jgi:hypothetical protein
MVRKIDWDTQIGRRLKLRARGYGPIMLQPLAHNAHSR